MATSIENTGQPNNDGVRFERVDCLTVNVYVEGPGDTTRGPCHPAVQKILDRDRQQIAELIAINRHEQERLNRLGPNADPDVTIS